MSEKHEIHKLYYDHGKTITEISKETGHDRKTVRTVLNNNDWNQEMPKAAHKQEFQKLDPFKAVIDSWLTDDKKARRKQRHTAKRVYDRLNEQYPDTFECSYRTVASYVARKKAEIFGKSPGHLPLEHIPGEAQADFGEADYYENGKLYNGHYLNLSFPNSNNGRLQLFKGENQECLFTGLITMFHHIGGVPPVIWFDNASSIVKKVLLNGEREVTDSFLRFQTHFGFSAQFCNPNAGHEKGNVENKVGYHRRNMLVPVPRFQNLSDFNNELLDLCVKDSQREHYRKNATIEELFHQDQAELLKLPSVPFDASKYITVKTNDYGRFYLNSGIHEYSVSPKYANTRVLVKLSANEVTPLDESYREIVHHERFYGSQKQQSMNWLPYLQQLSRRPGAIKYSGIYNMLPEPMQNYLDRCDKSTKGQVIKMIHELTEINGIDKAVETLDKALDYHCTDIDSLLNLHKRLHNTVVNLAPIETGDHIPHLPPVQSSLSNYDKHLTGQEALQ
jgi:transposase